MIFVHVSASVSVCVCVEINTLLCPVVIVNSCCAWLVCSACYVLSAIFVPSRHKVRCSVYIRDFVLFNLCYFLHAADIRMT